MLSRDSVKSRMINPVEKDDSDQTTGTAAEGISFTEFSYQIL